MKTRKIKPAFWHSPDVEAMSRDARLLFIGLWTFADDTGHLEDDASRLRSALFRGDWDVDDDDVESWLAELIGRGAVERVSDADGVRLLRVVNLRKHQGLNARARSRYALPDVLPVRVDPHGGRSSGDTADGGPTLPDDFPADLVGVLDRVLPVLCEIAEANRAPLPERVAVARCIADYADRDHLKVARDYRAWQLDVAKRKQRHIARGYRAQLDMAPAVARRLRPVASSSVDRSEERLRKAGL